MNHLRLCLFMLFISIFIAACALPPTLNVLGAYFPDWLFCILGGVIATCTLSTLLSAERFNDFLAPKLIFYPALTTLLSLLIWLFFFNLYL